MTRPAVACLAILLSLGSAQAAWAEADAVLEPKDKWVLNYANDSCRLARTFGEGDEQVVLILDQFQPADRVDVSLVGKKFARARAIKVPAATSFGPGLGAGKFSDALIGVIGADRAPILMMGARDLLNRPFVKGPDTETRFVFQTTPEQEAAINELQIRTGTQTLTLNTQSLGQPLAAMRKCLKDLVRDWGFDPEQQAALKQRAAPINTPTEWVRTMKAMPRAVLEGQSAVIRFRLMVDPQGKPTQCFIQNATLAAEIAKTTCDILLKGARFSPALDSEGKAIASYYINSMRWLSSP